MANLRAKSKLNILAFAKAQISVQVNKTNTAIANHRSEMPDCVALVLLCLKYGMIHVLSCIFFTLGSSQMAVLKTRTKTN
jgi:hypothetical protein